MDPRPALAVLLRRAYSGEMTAALAYHGHGTGLRDDREAAEIRRIEEEEWYHRRRLGAMLASLGVTPDPLLEVRMALLGTIICLGCLMVGWFIPMYFAGRLESQNDREYEEAAALADSLGMEGLRDELKAFAQLERDHEAYFLRKVAGHPALPFWKRLFGWGPGD